MQQKEKWQILNFFLDCLLSKMCKKIFLVSIKWINSFYVHYNCNGCIQCCVAYRILEYNILYYAINIYRHWSSNLIRFYLFIIWFLKLFFTETIDTNCIFHLRNFSCLDCFVYPSRTDDTWTRLVSIACSKIIISKDV